MKFLMPWNFPWNFSLKFPCSFRQKFHERFDAIGMLHGVFRQHVSNAKIRVTAGGKRLSRLTLLRRISSQCREFCVPPEQQRTYFRGVFFQNPLTSLSGMLGWSFVSMIAIAPRSAFSRSLVCKPLNTVRTGQILDASAHCPRMANPRWTLCFCPWRRPPPRRSANI